MTTEDGGEQHRPPLACWFLTGPTASGKTSVSLALAKRLDAEIISLDSMAFYRGMDIGTAKPTEQECRAVPHHLVNVLDPSEEFSLSQYVEAAHAAIADIESRGRQTLFAAPVMRVSGPPLSLLVLVRQQDSLTLQCPAIADHRRVRHADLDVPQPSVHRHRWPLRHDRQPGPDPLGRSGGRRPRLWGGH